MERALRALSWSQGDRYHDCPAADPRGRLEPGSIDDEGARRLGVPQTTYRGFVCELQADLRRFGFNPGPINGIYGPATERAVRFFQEAALTCPHRPGGATFSGGITGLVDDATRAEITIWRQRRFRRHMEPLTAERADGILAQVAETLYGPRACARVTQHPEKGFVHGLLDFDQRSGALGNLVWRMWSASPRSFRWLFKLGGEVEAVTKLTSRTAAQRMSLDLTTGPWTERFAKASDIDFWAREQMAIARAQRLDATLLLAAKAGLRTEPAIATVHLVLGQGGAKLAGALVRHLGRRSPGEPPSRHLRKAPAILERLAPASPLSKLTTALLAAFQGADCVTLAF